MTRDEVSRKRGRPKQLAKCHPDRPHLGRGLCKACYAAYRRTLPNARKTEKLAIKKWWKEHVAERNVIRRRHYRNRTRGKVLMRKYGISLEDFNKMGARQEGRCAICSFPLIEPHVDHDHKTGIVRGLLCFKCNIGLGSLNDSPQRLRSAAIYLESRLAA